MDIKIKVTGQKMTVVTPKTIYAQGSDNFVRLLFSLSSDWNGLSVFAQFRQGDKTSNEYLTLQNGYQTCSVPHWGHPGLLSVVLVGTGNGSVIATTHAVMLAIAPNGLVIDTDNMEVSPTLYQQLINIVLKKQDKIGNKSLSTNDFTTAEKNKLAGIADGANNYVLPTASADVKGGVQVGDGLHMENGVLAADVTDDDVSDYRAAWEAIAEDLEDADPAIIPLATSSTKGGFILNEDQMEMDEGVLSLKAIDGSENINVGGRAYANGDALATAADTADLTGLSDVLQWEQGDIVLEQVPVPGGDPINQPVEEDSDAAVRSDLFINSDSYRIEVPTGMRITAYYFAVSKIDPTDPAEGNMDFKWEFGLYNSANFTFINSAVMTEREGVKKFPSLMRLVAKWADGRDITPQDAVKYIKLYDDLTTAEKAAEQTEAREKGRLIKHENRYYADAGYTWESGSLRALNAELNIVKNNCFIRTSAGLQIPYDAKALLIYNPNRLKIRGYPYFAGSMYDNAVTTTEIFTRFTVDNRRRYRFEACLPAQVETDITPNYLEGRRHLSPENCGIRIYYETGVGNREKDAFAAGAAHRSGSAFFQPWKVLRKDAANNIGMPFVRGAGQSPGDRMPTYGAGYECQAFPYSSVFYNDGDVPYNRTFEAFYSAIQNPQSVLYTKIGGVYGFNLFTEYVDGVPQFGPGTPSMARGPYYGCVCSSMAQYVAGVDTYMPSANFNEIYRSCRLDVGGRVLQWEDLEPGMLLSDSGHQQMITNVYYAADERHVDIMEASMPVVSCSSFRWDYFKTTLACYGGTYGVYDLRNLHKMRDLTVNPFATDVIGEYGNETWYKYGDPVIMHFAEKEDGTLPGTVYYRKKDASQWSELTVDNSEIDMQAQLSEPGEWEITTNKNKTPYAHVYLVSFGTASLAASGDNLVVSVSSGNVTPKWWRIFKTTTKDAFYDYADVNGKQLAYAYYKTASDSDTAVGVIGHFDENGHATLPKPPAGATYLLRCWCDTGYGLTHIDTNTITL